MLYFIVARIISKLYVQVSKGKVHYHYITLIHEYSLIHLHFLKNENRLTSVIKYSQHVIISVIELCEKSCRKDLI